MKYEAIIRSIKMSLDFAYGRQDAVQRLSGYATRFAGVELRIKKERKYYSFYKAAGGKLKYLAKSSDELYKLARKKHCRLLIRILESHGKTQERWLQKLEDFLKRLEYGGLELERVVFTQKQYQWYRKPYAQKASGKASHQLGTIMVRSKSEQIIGRLLKEYGVPFHYEEKLVLDVDEVVSDLCDQLEGGNFFNWEFTGRLFFQKEGRLIWRLPSELQWMNSPGSAWKSFNPQTGKITIYPDFRIMLADGSFVFWEHEGLMDNFIYRCNANERISLMKSSGGIKPDNIIITEEEDVENDSRLRNLIGSRVLSRLWW